jgi:hypothetical protein
MFMECSIYYVYMDRSIYYLCGLFLTSFPSHYRFPLTAALDPYGEESITSSEVFDLAEYVKINANHDYKNHRMNGWSSLKAYINALIYLLDHQKDMGHNSLPYGSLRKNGDKKKLMDLVKTRHITVTKSNFDDSIKNASMRFHIVEKIPQIEEGFWNRNGHAKQWHVASLRDRYFYIFTKGGLVRGK